MNIITVRKLYEADYDDAIALVEKVFTEFEAPIYKPEGVEKFMNFLAADETRQSFLSGREKMWGAFDGQRIVSVIRMRTLNHISLVFTDKEYHRNGITREVFRLVLNDVLHDYPQIYRLTVNSSPYGLPFYTKLGFKPTELQRCDDGIVFTPMEYIIDSTQAIETERLILRPYEERDTDAVHRYAGNNENIKYMMSWGPNNDIAQTETFIKEAIAKHRETPKTQYEFAVILKESGRLIGGCGIYVKDDTANLGWVLHKDYQKQGFGTEFARALISFGFTKHKLHRITAYCHAANYGSYRVMERSGMRREGHIVKGTKGWSYNKEIYADALQYAILRDEWKEK